MSQVKTMEELVEDFVMNIMEAGRALARVDRGENVGENLTIATSHKEAAMEDLTRILIRSGRIE